jgi:hypothetical protein
MMRFLRLYNANGLSFFAYDDDLRRISALLRLNPLERQILAQFFRETVSDVMASAAELLSDGPLSELWDGSE